MNARPVRRLESGDWVRLPASPAVGKIVEGDFDLADDHLRGALVEAEGRTAWRAIGPLVRVTPEEEARLVEAAQAERLLDPKRAWALLDRLAAFRAGKLKIVRSPGLLDLLWTRTSRADPQRGSQDLTELLDHAADRLLARERERPPAPAPLAPQSRESPPPTEASPVQMVTRFDASRVEPSSASSPAVTRSGGAGRAPSRRDVDPRVSQALLDVLDRATLRWLADHLALPIEGAPLRDELLALVLAAGPTTRELVQVMTTYDQRLAARRLGLAADGEASAVRARLVRCAEGGGPIDGAVARAILAAHDDGALRGVAGLLGLTAGPGLARAHLDAIVLGGAQTIQDLVEAIGAPELRVAARALGIAEAGVDPRELGAQLVARASGSQPAPGAPSSDVLAAVDPVELSRTILGVLDDTGLRWVAELLGLQVEPGPPPREELVASILTRPATVRDLVGVVRTHELRAAARQLGLHDADADPVTLRSRLIARAERAIRR